MSDHPTVTEREAVQRERDAFAAGGEWEARNRGHPPLYPFHETAKRYPLPKVRRLREKVLGPMGGAFRWNPESGFEVRNECGEWQRAGMTYRPFIEEHIEALADLKANPWEEVDG